MTTALTKLTPQTAALELLGQENAELIAQAAADLARVEPTLKLWNKSHSDYTWNLITVGGEHTPARRLRQVAAELQRKQAALIEAGYAVAKRLAQAQMKRVEAEAETDPAKRSYMELCAHELEAKAEMVRQPYTGAARDVVQLAKLHDALVKQVADETGTITPEIIEAAEARYWVRRSFAQSLRDIRASGYISKGEQELLEQIGLNPTTTQKFLSEYLETEPDNMSSAPLERFLDQASERFSFAAIEKMQRIGFMQGE